MEVKWMGRYREIIRNIMRHGNLYARTYNVQLADGTGVTLSSLEWQAFECIVEFESEDYNMSVLSEKIGIPRSNFSKYVNTMLEYKLVERFQKVDNKKDIILKVTDFGKEFYRARSSYIADEWEDVFDILDNFTEEQLAQVALFIEKLSESFDPHKTKVSKLKKIK